MMTFLPATTLIERLRALGAAALVLVAGGCGAERRTAPAESAVRAAFPDVQHLATSELAQAMAADEAPVLLDVREPEEFAVSHIEGAIRISPSFDDLAALDSLPRDTPIVAYCSIGWRSSEAVRELRSLGFTDVRNLSGSLFRWANEGRPMVAPSGSTRVAHPYDANWGRLLRPELRSYTSD